MRTFTYLTLALSLFIAGCGGKSKLTAEQKAEFADTMESTGRGQKVAETSSKASGRVSFMSTEDLSAKDIESKIYSKLQSAQNKCTYPEPSFSQGKISWGVEGAECPMTMKFSFEQAGAMGMKMELNYLVQDDEIKKLNDVYGMTLGGTITGSEKGAGGTLKGSIKSAKHGEIPVALSLNASESSVEMTYSVDMPKAPVEMKVAMNKDGKAEYTINGESMDQSEFQALLAKGGPGFTSPMSFGGSQGGSGSGDMPSDSHSPSFSPTDTHSPSTHNPSSHSPSHSTHRTFH